MKPIEEMLKYNNIATCMSLLITDNLYLIKGVI